MSIMLWSGDLWEWGVLWLRRVIIIIVKTMIISIVDLLFLIHVFSFEINLEKYKKIIRSPLIIIKINIKGRRDLDFARIILIDKMML